MKKPTLAQLNKAHTIEDLNALGMGKVEVKNGGSSMTEGGDIEKGHRKLYVQTGNGRIPVTILNKLSKELYGIPNWYTLDGQDGNAGQTVVMEALNRKGTEGYEFSTSWKFWESKRETYQEATEPTSIT